MLIINANIQTMTGNDYKNGYILMEQGKITAVGDMAQAPKADCLYDAHGAFALPGFIDAHCHIGMWEDGLGFEGDDGNEDTDPSTPHLRGIDGVNPFDRAFSEALDYGVTTVVTGPGSANPIAGQMCALKTYGRRVDDMIVRAPLAIKMALGENPKTSYHEKQQGPATRMGIAAVIREQLAKARRYAQEMDEAAQDDEIDEPEFDAICEALLPLLDGRIKAHIHAHRADDIFTGIRIAKEFGFGYVIVHGTEAHLVADLLAGEDASVIAGPLLGARTKPELANSSAAGIAAISRAGVRVAVATDHPELPCYCLLLSAQLAADSGLEPAKALRAITADAAEICAIGDRVGSIAPGYDADIVLFDEEPIKTRKKPQAVFIDGEKVRG